MGTAYHRREGTWTTEQFKAVETLWNDPKRFSCSEIAAEINARFGTEFSRNAVIGKINRENLPKRMAIFTKRRDPANAKMAARKFRKPDQTFHGDGLVDLPVLLNEPEFLGRTLNAVKDSECHYPHGEDAPYLYCGHPVQEGSSYCSFHHRLCYTKPDTRPRKVFVLFRSAA